MNKRRLSLITVIMVCLIVFDTMLIIITPAVEESIRTLKAKDSYQIDREKVSTAPKLYFTGDMSNMTSKKDIRNIKFSYDDEVNDVFNAYAQIKLQGSSSLAYDKKNYTITFFKDEKCKEKLNIDVGFGAQSKYCLKANWIDFTHARNIVSARLGAILQSKSGRFEESPNNGLIDGFPVEIYLNDEFLGLYTWNIPKDAWMWALNEKDPLNVVVGIDGYSQQTYFREPISDWDESLFEMEVGEYSDELKDNLNRLITFISTSTDEEFVEHFDEYLDKESVINYELIMCVINGVDITTKNMMLVTYDQKVWYPSLYDLDTTYGVDWQGKEIIDYSFVPQNDANLLWYRFTRLFWNDLCARYKELRKDVFTKESIMNIFEDFRSTIPDELMEKEREKWPDAPGYGYDQIEEYLDYKLPYLDEYFSRENL